MAATPQPHSPSVGERSGGPAVLSLLGLAGRAGGIVLGIDSVRTRVREGKVLRVILAADTAAGQRDKLLPLLEARRVPFHTMFTRDQMGAALGRESISAVGITDRNFARRLGELIDPAPSDRFTAEP